jgi:hypothetical protein
MSLGIKKCHYCETELSEELLGKPWNLFPIGANEANTTRIYDWDKVICDDCYDDHCVKWGIEMLEGDK